MDKRFFLAVVVVFVVSMIFGFVNHGYTLAEEYRLLEEQAGFSREQIRQLILNGIEATWMPEARKETMGKSFVDDMNWMAS